MTASLRGIELIFICSSILAKQQRDQLYQHFCNLNNIGTVSIEDIEDSRTLIKVLVSTSSDLAHIHLDRISEQVDQILTNRSGGVGDRLRNIG